MTKNIVLLSDGTGNSSTSPHKTNIWRLYKAIDKSPINVQIAFYDNGVGTSSFIIKKLLGQAFGWGLKRNVQELYLNLCRVYNEGDKIFIYGYSRGAFTARILAALIANQGIIKNSKDELDLKRKVEKAYNSFRHETFVPSVLTTIPWLIRYFMKSSTPDATNFSERHRYKPGDNPLIEMLGVWDTVDAYGAPIDELTRGWDMVVWPLTAKDRNLHPAIGAAYHALALDEQREAFEPMLWNEDGDTFTLSTYTKTPHTTKNPRPQKLEQVWFAGVHANVGGGNPDDSLSYVSLSWMIKNAIDHGLKIEDELKGHYEIAADTNGPIYNNRAGFGNVYRFSPRKVETLCKSEKPGLANTILSIIGSPKAQPNEVQIDCPKIHTSVFNRIRNGGDAYAPINLPAHYCVVEDNSDTPINQPSKIPHKNRLIETKEQAGDRRTIQSEVWNLVWLQRVFYFLFVTSLLLYVSGPYWLLEDSTSEINRSANIFLGSIGDLLRLIPLTVGSIPGLEPIGGWAKRYNDFPYFFVFGAFFLFFLVTAGLIIQGRRRSKMRKHLSHIWGNDIEVAGYPNERSKLTLLLDSFREPDLKKHKIRTSFADSGSNFFRLIIEGIAAVFFLIILYIIAWKIVFTILDGTGQICEPPKEISNTNDNNTSIQSIDFDPTNPCLDTGFELLEGKEYTIKLEVPANWSDGSIDADTLGLLTSPTMGMNLLSPFRRHFAKDWYQPIGRIGHRYYDRYTAKIEPSDEPLKQANKGLLRNPELCKAITFKARQSGRLYFYLNDAVAPWPFVRWQFYENNCKAGKCVASEENRELAELFFAEVIKGKTINMCDPE